MRMTLLAFALAVGTAGQAPAPAAEDPARAIAPFVEPDTLAIVQLNLDHIDLQKLAAHASGEDASGSFAENMKDVTGLMNQLRAAGAHRLHVLINLGDMPGPPVVVAPGANADAIAGLLCNKEGGKGGSRMKLPACATIRGAVVAGSQRAVDRIKGLTPTPRPELEAAFAAVPGDSIGARILLIPSADTRRVIEEMVPELPPQLGGGPVTNITRGVLWMAAGVGLDGDHPTFRLVVASPDGQAAHKIEQTGRSAVDLLAQAPFDPAVPGLVSRLKSEIEGARIVVSGDADTAAGLIAAVVRPARAASTRSVCVNNEKQMALALHNYASAHKGKFPPAYTTDRDGKPLLSWRVLILPYLEQDALFKEFHQDEPWDSPHNKALIDRMPVTYRCPLQSVRSAREGKTRYVGLRGPNTIFRGAQDVGLRDITDGTSNTIFFLDAGDAHAVIWTKPDDLDMPADEAGIKAVLGAHPTSRGRGTDFAFVDGSVHFLREGIKFATFKALASFSGGEVISSDDF
ncbi:MAG: DUF1559 family PulG-like putative transporter [Isosphaeraceae bacterium]